MEYVTGLNLDLSWEGNADAYGGTVDVYRWGWDIPDLEESVGWSPWSTETVLESPAPTDPGIHALAIQARDNFGNVTTQSLTMNLLEPAFARSILVVDDFRDNSFPRDEEHDAFWRGLLENSGSFLLRIRNRKSFSGTLSGRAMFSPSPRFHRICRRFSATASLSSIPEAAGGTASAAS